MTVQLDISFNTVGAIMTSWVVTIQMDETLQVIRDLFQRVKFHHLVVVDEGRVVGIISDRDFFKAMSPLVVTSSETDKDCAILEKRAHQIMSHYPVTVLKSCPIEKAAKIMLERRFSCLPVINPDHLLEGILTWKDLCKGFLEADAHS